MQPGPEQVPLDQTQLANVPGKEGPLGLPEIRGFRARTVVSGGHGLVLLRRWLGAEFAYKRSRGRHLRGGLLAMEWLKLCAVDSVLHWMDDSFGQPRVTRATIQWTS